MTDFRRNLASIHQDAYDTSLEAALDRIEKVDGPHGPMIPVEDNMVAMYEALDVAAEAVYAQALRDVREAMENGRYHWFSPDIERFADERGIDLTDPEAK